MDSDKGTQLIPHFEPFLAEIRALAADRKGKLDIDRARPAMTVAEIEKTEAKDDGFHVTYRLSEEFRSWLSQ